MCCEAVDPKYKGGLCLHEREFIYSRKNNYSRDFTNEYSMRDY